MFCKLLDILTVNV
jgi:hypothetical protein